MYRRIAFALTAAALAACSNAGQIGDILGGVLGGTGGAGASTFDGTVRGVDTRNQQVSIQDAQGQTVPLLYDNKTQVVYNNQTYPITSLEVGDRVSAHVQQTQNGGYYTDRIDVTQSATTSSGGTSGNEQSLQGNVRGVDRQNALFTIDAGSGVVLTVTMPSNAAATDVNRFNSLRTGEYVRLYGVYVTNTRVELHRFY